GRRPRTTRSRGAARSAPRAQRTCRATRAGRPRRRAARAASARAPPERGGPRAGAPRPRPRARGRRVPRRGPTAGRARRAAASPVRSKRTDFRLSTQQTVAPQVDERAALLRVRLGRLEADRVRARVGPAPREEDGVPDRLSEARLVLPDAGAVEGLDAVDEDA